MRFIVDAQLPIKLSEFLINQNHDSIHTSQLPNRNSSTDQEIVELSLHEKRIVISKDSDFYNRYLRLSEPHKLIIISTGNISNQELLKLIDKNFGKIAEEIELNNVIEITANSIITIL